MFSVFRSALVNYSAEQMFALVNDVESYPQFMKDCVGADILEQSDTWLEARLTLGYKGIQQSFVTRNELDPPNKMLMHLKEGPFTEFEGCWQFQSLKANACKVSLDLQFDFSNPLLKLTVGKWLEALASHQVNELCERADKVYAES